jgi:hypothetical protein
MVLPFDRLLQEYAIYMYWGGLERLGLSLAWKAGLHPVTLAHLADIPVVSKIGTSLS